MSQIRKIFKVFVCGFVSIAYVMSGFITYADMDNKNSTTNIKSEEKLTTFGMYWSPIDELIGISFEEKYKHIDLYYRYGNEDFRCKKNIDLDILLDIPEDKEYLEAYIRVVDENGNLYESNIVTFYRDGTDCYEVIRDSDGDGIGDAYEIRDLGTNPYMVDTDGNGVIDAYDIYTQDDYYNIKIYIDKAEYEEICSVVGEIFYIDTITEEKYECYPKKSKVDVVTYNYDDNGELVTTIYNKISRQKTLKYYNNKYVQYIYSNFNQRIATLANNGDNFVSNVYSYDEYGNLKTIVHNDFEYNLEYSEKENIAINIAGKPYISYEYNKENISKIIYGNEQEINIECDDIGNILKISDNEKCLYEWKYGDYYMVDSYIDYVSGVITKYSYEDGMVSYIKDNKNRSIHYIYRSDGTSKIVNTGNQEYTSNYIMRDNYYISQFNGILTKETKQENTKATRILYDDDILVTSEEISIDNMVIKNIGSDEYKYIFSKEGNLLEEYVNGELENTYEYDDFSQIKRINSKELNMTVIYIYDKGGNIVCKKSYKLSFDKKTIDLKNEIQCNYYNYDADWRDMMVSCDNDIIEYDAIGNPVKYIDNISFDWEQGRNLREITNKNGDTIIYTYNSEGIRTSKNINGNIVQYMLEGSKVLYEKRNDYDIYYIYDENSELTGFIYQDNIYIYKKNLSGDIIGIYDIKANEIVSYKYDVWGKLINVVGDTEIASVNPYRYKGYYYDKESGLYYMNLRYYDPNTGRFINADKYIDTNTGINSNNMFEYCKNNPVNIENYINRIYASNINVENNEVNIMESSSPRPIYIPVYSTLYAWEPDIMRKYNCYGYAINYYKSFVDPGYFSGNSKINIDLKTIVNRSIEDLKKLGYSNVREISKSEIENASGTVIALRVGEYDYHWMRYAKRLGGWYHKPGGTAILKLKGNPYDYTQWTSEHYVGYWERGSSKYTSNIKYIIYTK